MTTQVGDLLATTSTTGFVALWTPQLFAKLALVTLLSASPLLFKSRLQRWLGGGSAEAPTHLPRSRSDDGTFALDLDMDIGELPLPAGASYAGRRRLASVDGDPQGYFAVATS